MKKFITLLFLLGIVSLPSSAQYLEELLKEETEDGFFDLSRLFEPVPIVKEYNSATYPLQRVRILNRWIKQSQYAQTYYYPKRGIEVTKEKTLFEFSKGNYRFSDYREGFGFLPPVPNENYSIGMADNISKPSKQVDVKITTDKIIYTITTNQQGACDFLNTDEWTTQGDGAARGGVPVQPKDVHKEMGCNGGTCKVMEVMFDEETGKELKCPITKTCTHYIRQVPRSSGRRVGRKVVASKAYSELDITPGKVYIGTAGEYGGDPFAPWQFTYKTTATISLSEMARLNNLTKEELAFKMILSSQMSSYREVPHPIEVFSASNYDVFAYGLWKLFGMDAYISNIVKDLDQKAKHAIEQGDYPTAARYLEKAMFYETSDDRLMMCERFAYTALKEKVDNKTVTLSELKDYVDKYSYKKDSVILMYNNQYAIELVTQLTMNSSDEDIEYLRSLATDAETKMVIEENIARIHTERALERDRIAREAISKFTVDTPQEEVDSIAAMDISDEVRSYLKETTMRIDEEKEHILKQQTQTPFLRLGVGGNAIFGNQREYGLGTYLKFGRCHHMVNVTVGADFDWVNPSGSADYTSDGEDGIYWGVKYKRVSIPVELYYNFMRSYAMSCFAGVGATYKSNLGGKVYSTNGESIPVGSGLNRDAWDGKVFIGLSMKYMEIMAICKFNILNGLNPESLDFINPETGKKMLGPIEAQFSNGMSFGVLYRIYFTLIK